MLEGKVENLFIGDQPQQSFTFTHEGIEGDKHQKWIKRAGPRERMIPKGNTIWNWRSWSAVSIEELAKIAEKLGLPEVTAEHLLANISVSGVSEFTQLPAGSLITLPSKLTLYVTGYNDPCVIPGNRIQETHSEFRPGQFVKNAKGLRGLVGVVFHPGAINVGDNFTVSPYQTQEEVI